MKKIIILAAIAVTCTILCILTIVLNMSVIWTILSGLLSIGATLSTADHIVDLAYGNLNSQEEEL